MAREDLTDRLMARSSGLARRSLGGVDNVFSGEVGDRALEALGARAITLDGQIILNSQDDPEKNAEHAALLAHEDLHARNSGGSGGQAAGHNTHGEEEHAKNAEAMTFHLLSQGDLSLGEVIAEVRKGGASSALALGGSTPAELVSRFLIGGDRDRDPMAAYTQMRLEGRSHAQIVDELSRHVMDNLDRLNAEHAARTGETDFVG